MERIHQLFCVAILCLLAALWLAPGASADIAPGATGSFADPFIGEPPFQNLICCTDVLECSDGDDVYENCRMPTSAAENWKLCGYNTPNEEYPFICDYCPGAARGGDCDGGGWVSVGRGQFQCDGPVYRGQMGGVRNLAPDTWYVYGAGVEDYGSPLTAICNDSDELCQNASCFENDCISCSSIDTANGFGMCPNEAGAQCHGGGLEGSSALLCCSEVNLSCTRPNSTTGDCSGSPAYDVTFTTLASCEPCPNPDNPANEEACHGWDLGDDIWFPPAEELGSSNSLSCNSEDEVGCKMAIYACDGTLTTTGGIELGISDCLSASCDGI